MPSPCSKPDYLMGCYSICSACQYTAKCASGARLPFIFDFFLTVATFWFKLHSSNVPTRLSLRTPMYCRIRTFLLGYKSIIN